MMRRTLRIVVVVSIGLIIVYLLFLAVETLFIRKAFGLSVFMQLGSILLSFGSLFYHYRKLRPKYQSEEIESALDDDLTREEVPAMPIPGILKLANGLYGVWAGFISVTLIGMLSTIDHGVNFDSRLLMILITAILCSYTCLFIVGVGIIEFFTPSKGVASESVENKAQRP